MVYYTPVTHAPPTLRFDFAGETLLFRRPLETVQATRLDEVLGVLQAVQRASEAGLYAAGYVTYEAAPAFDGALTTHPPTGHPLVWFGLFSDVERLEASEISKTAHTVKDWTLDTSKADYHAAIAKIRNNIAAGVTYQANYTVRLQTPNVPSDPYALYRSLQQQHRPPYSSFLDTGELKLVSLSPELFFSLEGRTVTTRPMKGTTARGRFSEEDERLKTALRQSPKERAENVMITDMLRSDLGKLALPGSVAVPELLTLETYPTFHTLTSAITAELPEKIGLPELFQALFPCASVTGAPKASTMRVLQGLETTPRGVYCGALGYVKPGGDAVFSVPIRTLTLTSKGAKYGVGSGVTWDSRAEAEYEELAVKAALVTAVKPDFSLLETLRWDGQQFVRLERHLARVAASAAFFGIPLEPNAIRRKLMQHGLEYRYQVRRVRALVSQTGRINVESGALELSEALLTAALAKEAVDSQDVFLFHKTTHRAVYNLRCQDAPDADDVLLWNERGELTEFTVGNLVLELNGELLTPPRKAGLLGGVLRQEGLEQGSLKERALYPADLARATQVWRSNSLRGWQSVSVRVKAGR